MKYGPTLEDTVFSIVPPSRVMTDPALAVNCDEPPMLSFAPFRIVIVPVPSAIAVPARVMLPLLTSMAERVLVPLPVTV